MEEHDEVLARVCGNCHGGHPSGLFESNFAICLRDPEFEPYLDDIIDRQDFSRCQDLVQRKHFA